MKFNYLLLIFASFLFFVSCSDDSDGSGAATLQVNLVDGPGDFEAVLIDIQEFHVNYSNDDNSGWTEFDIINPGVYDLLELTGGVSLPLINEELPAGIIRQIRLVLGENNTIIIDGEESDLRTPSAQQSGLKINVQEKLQENISYELTLDFDVDESIVIAGNSGNINLKPTIRAIPIAQTGAITGTINPSDTQILVTAFQNGVEVANAFANDNGDFVIAGLDDGQYSLVVEPAADSNYNTVDVDDINVSIGSVTDVDTISIN